MHTTDRLSPLHNCNTANEEEDDGLHSRLHFPAKSFAKPYHHDLRKDRDVVLCWERRSQSSSDEKEKSYPQDYSTEGRPCRLDNLHGRRQRQENSKVSTSKGDCILTQLNNPDAPKFWPSYGFSIILPSPAFGVSMKNMRYLINPFMSKGGMSNMERQQFTNDLQKIGSLISSWLNSRREDLTNMPSVYEIGPIASNFNIKSLLDGVRNEQMTNTDKQKLMNTLNSTVSSKTIKDEDGNIRGTTVVKNYDRIIKALREDRYFADKPNAEKVINSISSGIPDAIYLANAGLNLGRSPLLDNKSVFIIQSPRAVERQVENAFTRSLSIQMGSFPIEMKKIYEGMADSVAALVNRNGKKEKVLLGFKSSRSDPTVYTDIVDLASKLKVVPAFPKEVVILESNKDIQEYAYHMDLAMLTLPNCKVCVGEGIFTLDTMDNLHRLFDQVYIIPKKEWIKFALNSILIDERLGIDTKNGNKIPRLAIIPPNSPALGKVLDENGFEIIVQDLAYGQGGGFMRCLTLFADVDLSLNHNDTVSKKEEYQRHVKKVTDTLSQTEVGTLHWDSQIHEMTETLYGLF